MAALGERFVAALASEDEKAYLACWCTSKELMQFSQGIPDGPEVTEDMLRTAREYGANVHKVAKKAFGQMLANLRKAGIRPRTIQYHSVKARVEKKQGMEGASTVEVYFTSPDKPGETFHIWIDDAFKIDGDWRFADKPRSEIGVSP